MNEARLIRLIITCEHGGNDIPHPYRHLFTGKRNLLDSHKGHDLGALSMARTMAKRFDAPLYAATRSRLLIDLNRSIGNPALFSEITRSLAPKEKEAMINTYYSPHRTRIRHAVGTAIHAGEKVLHIAVHSFSPLLKGRVRYFGIALRPAAYRRTALLPRMEKNAPQPVPHIPN